MNTDEPTNDERDLEERIRARAHEIWEHEGRPPGRAELHWEQARREIEFEAARAKSDQPSDVGKVSNTPKPRTRKRA